MKNKVVLKFIWKNKQERLEENVWNKKNKGENSI